MPLHADGSGPYAPPKAVLAVINGYRERGLSTPITLGVLRRAGISESLCPRTLQALKLLDLVDETGNPTPALEDLAKAASDDFSDRLAAVLRGAYADVFQFVEPRDDPPEKVRDAFRTYKPRGQQERMVTLFLGLCEAAGLVDKQPRRPRVRSSKPRKPNGTTARRQQPETPGTPTRPETPSPPEFTPSPSPQTGQHPFIRGLLQTLPEVGSTWPQSARKKWTDAAMAVFDLIYEASPKDQKGGESSR